MTFLIRYYYQQSDRDICFGEVEGADKYEAMANFALQYPGAVLVDIYSADAVAFADDRANRKMSMPTLESSKAQQAFRDYQRFRT
jgi:hypothetical protein